MEPQWIYEQLSILAERLGIVVVETNLKQQNPPAKSGVCKVGDRYLVVTDKQDPIEKKIDLLVSCLKRHDLDSLYVLPKLRDFLDNLTP